MTGLVSGTVLRLHFNKHGAAPRVWTVACGEFEIECKGFMSYIPLETVYRPKETPDDEDGKPSAWLAPVQISRNYVVTAADNGFVTIRYEDAS